MRKQCHKPTQSIHFLMFDLSCLCHHSGMLLVVYCVFQQSNKQRNITQSAKSYVPTIQAKQNTPTISTKSYTPGLSETIIQDNFDFLITQDLAYLTTQDGDYLGFDKKFIGDIFIKPARSINFITLNFIAARTSVNFNEIGG